METGRHRRPGRRRVVKTLLTGDFSVYVQWPAEDIVQEWEQIRPKTAHLNLLTVYFGAPPPLVDLEKILKALGGHPKEITLEIQNATLLEAMAWRQIGINRIHCPYDEEIVSTLIQAGFDNISTDIPVETTLTLPVTHVSFEEFDDPDLCLKAIEGLENAGFERYELFSFCKDQKRSLHTSGYALGRPYIGLGPNAHSYFDGVRSTNGGPSEKLSPEEQLKELFILRLRFKEGVDLKEFESLPKETKEALKKLEEIGWIKNSATKPQLTLEGLLFYDEIAAELI